MKLSLNIGSREFGLSFGKKAFNPGPFLRGDDIGAGGANMTSSYQQSVWVYSCVSAIAEQVAQIPFRFSRVSKSGAQGLTRPTRRKSMGEDIVESGPVVDLFNRPHPQLNRFQFWELAVSWLQLRGEVFAVPVMDGRRITRLVVVSPDQFRHIVRSNELLGWSYQGSGTESPLNTQELLPEEVIFDRLANPHDFWRGMSPLTVANLAASTDYASAQFQTGLMLNNADTGVVVTTDQQVDEAQREAILSALKDRKRKAGTADRPLFLWGGAKVEKPTLSASDMQYLENRKFNRQEICAVFKVPQEIIGFTEDANRSVSESARLNFVENRISPLCERLEAAFDPLIKAIDPTLWGWFDIECLPIMAAARRERYTSATVAFNMGVPIDECGEIFDLGLPMNLPHAGKSFLPFSLQEVGSSATTGNDELPPVVEPVTNIFERAGRLLSTLDSRLSTPAHQCAPNPEYEASIAGSVKVKAGSLKKFFFEQRGRVLAKLATEVSKSAEKRGLDDIFNMDAENKTLLGKMTSKLIADLEFGGAQLFKEIGAGNFNLPPTQALAFLDKRENPIKNINSTTWDRLKSALSEGISAGESYADLAERVKSQYNTSEERADTIAFTETNIAVNSGRNEAMKQAKVERKGWQTARMEGTRVSHLANENLTKEQGGIPIADNWPNGLAYPGDPSGEPGETINCRCFGYAVIGKGRATAPLLRFDEWIAAKSVLGAKGVLQ
jgi:HK97 family phage portal protein